MNDIKTDIDILKDYLGIFEHVADNLDYDYQVYIYKDIHTDEFDSVVDYLVEHFDAEKDYITYNPQNARRSFSVRVDYIVFIAMEVDE